MPDDFDPTAFPLDLLSESELALLPPEEPTGPPDNLAEMLEKHLLDRIAYDVIEDFQIDESGRQEWRERERDGIQLLGISKNVPPGANFAGSSEVVYSGLVEATIAFQARALTELWPADGPVKSVVLGTPTPETEAQADRVEGYLNYLYTEKMPGAFDEVDRLLFRLPLSGSAFTHLCYDPLEDCIVKRFMPAEDVIVPYEATDIRTAPRYTILTRYTRQDLRRLMRSGFYLTIDLAEPADERLHQERTLADEKDSVDLTFRADYGAGRHVVYVQLRYLDLDDPVNPENELPYYVHVEAQSQRTLAIYPALVMMPDGTEKIRHHITHYKFLPGLGFYGLGYLHILSHMARSETGALRALMDSALYANQQGGYHSRDVHMADNSPVAPGEFRETKATAEELNKAFFPLPSKEPSQTLFELLQWLDEVFRRTAGTTEVAVGDASPANAPVGTTLALLEQSLKVQTGVHIRLHNAQKQEFHLLHDLCHDYLPPEYPYFVEGEERFVKATDFDDRVDVVPVSDPNIVSSMQRVALAQAQLELANANPDLYDRRAVHERLLQAMRVPFHEQILPDQSQVPRRDPVSENMALTMQEAVQAFPDQDHQAHLLVHRSWLQALDPDTLNQAQAQAMAHIAEHVALDYQLRMMQAMGLEAFPQDPQAEAQLTYLAAQAAQLMANQQQEPPPQDPMEMKAMADIVRKDAEAEARIEREDAVAIAKMNRDVARDEIDMLRRSVSDETIESGEKLQ